MIAAMERLKYVRISLILIKNTPFLKAHNFLNGGCKNHCEERIKTFTIQNELNNNSTKNDDFFVKAPAYRFDVNREIDEFEEVLRIYGYKNVPDATKITFP